MDRLKYSVIALALIVISTDAAATRFRGRDPRTQQLVVAAYKILELGYQCGSTGTSIEACRAQLQTQLNARLK